MKLRTLLLIVIGFTSSSLVQAEMLCSVNLIKRDRNSGALFGYQNVANQLISASGMDDTTIEKGTLPDLYAVNYNTSFALAGSIHSWAGSENLKLEFYKKVKLAPDKTRWDLVSKLDVPGEGGASVILDQDFEAMAVCRVIQYP